VLVDVVDDAETRIVSKARAETVFQSTHGHPSYLSNYPQSLLRSGLVRTSRMSGYPHLESKC